MAAVGRAPQIVTVKSLCWPGGLEAEIEEVPHFVGFGYRVASENSVLENTGEGPVYAGIGGITPATLPKVGGYVVKLPPGDCHPVPICWVNGNNTLVGRVADDVVAILINISLITNEEPIRRDHSRRGLNFPRRRRRVIVFFEMLSERRPLHWRQLG